MTIQEKVLRGDPTANYSEVGYNFGKSGCGVMVSIRPEWCYLFITGEKKIEARKSKPRIPTPFTGFIYCTQGDTLYRSKHDGLIRITKSNREQALGHHTVFNGKVIGEFFCTKLCWMVSHPAIFAGHDLFHEYAIKQACLSIEQAEKYSRGKDVYGWCVSSLKIYEIPKDIQSFGLKRAPQSWCYVNEKTK